MDSIEGTFVCLPLFLPGKDDDYECPSKQAWKNDNQYKKLKSSEQGSICR
jgi:hypothetical protein